MTPERSYLTRISSISNIEDAKKVFPIDWFIPGKWVNFQSLTVEGFAMKESFDRIGWTQFLEMFN